MPRAALPPSLPGGRRRRHQQQPDARRARGRARRPARAVARRRRAPRRRRRARQGDRSTSRRCRWSRRRTPPRPIRAEAAARADARDDPGLVVRPRQAPRRGGRAGRQQPERRRQPAPGAPRARTARATPKCASRCSRRSSSVRSPAGLGRAPRASSSPASASARCCSWSPSGLAITYGLMGVINMAHGELMMIGAYTTYVVQNLFRAYVPGRLRRLRAGCDPGRVPASRRWSARRSSAA